MGIEQYNGLVARCDGCGEPQLAESREQVAGIIVPAATYNLNGVENGPLTEIFVCDTDCLGRAFTRAVNKTFFP